MSSYRSYLIRAIYEWAVDNEMTPMVMVLEAGAEHGAALEEGRLTVYNISPAAVRDLVIDEDSVRFHARFQGVSRHVVLDMRTVARVYSRETDEGLRFAVEDEPLPPTTDEEPLPSKGRPHLKLVK